MGKSDPGAIDREQMGDIVDSPCDVASIADLMRGELESVLASPDFLRAPTMNRLLVYLVTETAEGRADQLKAYSVAVDGLGRAPDYDARADSYPRVQVGRLRRMLETYYASNAPVAGHRLTIPNGRYRVAMAAEHPAIEEEPTPATPPATDFSPSRRDMLWTMLLFVAVLSASALGAYLSPSTNWQDSASPRRPLLELAPIAHDDAGRRRSDAVQATLINGLGRSEMFDLRIARPTGERGTARAPARYRLSSDLLQGTHPRLFLRLWQQGPDQLLWSGDVILPADGEGNRLEDVLAPVIATIGRANGLIAIHELQSPPTREPLGYRCMLMFQNYRKERLVNDREPVRDCIERSIAANPEDATMQAIAAQFELDRVVSSQTPADQRPGLFLSARRHAQLATTINPMSAWAIATRARIAVLRQACPIAVRDALRAADLQPYDPTLLADAGISLLNCQDPRAEEVMRHAIALDDGSDGQFYPPLLLLAISRGDQRLAQEALARMSPPLFGRHAGYYMTTAVGYAMIGDLPHARAAWRQLKTSSGQIAADPQSYLDRLGVAEPVKREAMRQLRTAGLIV